MSDNHVGMTKTTPQQFFVALWAGLFAPIIAIALVIGLVVNIQSNHGKDDAPSYNEKATLERIKPVGELTVVDASAPRVEKEGSAVFSEVCASCHTSGALGAPKFGDKSEWAARIKQGYDTLVKHAVEGIRQMPARGGNPDLSDTEVARAVAYMANEAGAQFTPPAAGGAAVAAAAPSAGAAASAPAAPAPGAPAAANAAPAGTMASAAVRAGSAEAVAASGADGKKIFDASCVACHGSGVAGAPKAGDKAAWAPRIKTGKDALYASALNGKNAMPAKGGNPALSETEVKAAVDYMVGLAK